MKVEDLLKKVKVRVIVEKDNKEFSITLPRGKGLDYRMWGMIYSDIKEIARRK